VAANTADRTLTSTSYDPNTYTGTASYTTSGSLTVQDVTVVSAEEAFIFMAANP
jgi:hypothetical protein